MSKILDLMYYYVYQNSRKNKHEKDHHLVAVLLVTVYLGTFLGLINTGFTFPLLFKPFGVRSETTLLFIAIITILIGDKINKYYLEKGKKLINQYDKKYTYKHRNKYIDSAVLFISFILMIPTVLLLGFIFRKAILFF